MLLLLAITISASVTTVLIPTRRPSASAIQIFRPPLILQALVGRRPLVESRFTSIQTASSALPTLPYVSRMRSSPWTKRAQRSLRLNQSPSITRRSLIRRVFHNLASWPRTWRMSIRILIARDRDGRPYTVRYEAVNAMLLNEFLKEHRTVQELKSTVASQEATISQQKTE